MSDLNLKRLEELAEEGLNLGEIAELIGIKRTQLVYQIEKFDSVRKAIIRGQSRNPDITPLRRVKPLPGDDVEIMPAAIEKAAVADQSRENIKRQIEKSIEKGFCTFSQIRKFLRFPDAQETMAILGAMELEGEVFKRDHGTISAYFLPGKIPEHFWLQEGGTVGMVLPDKPIVIRTVDSAIEKERGNAKAFTIKS